MIIVHPEPEFAQLDNPLDAKVLLRHPLIMTGRDQPESLSTHSHIELVRAGLGMGVTTQLAVDVALVDGLIVRTVDHPDAVREVSLYWPRNKRLSAAGQALRDFILLEYRWARRTRDSLHRHRTIFHLRRTLGDVDPVRDPVLA